MKKTDARTLECLPEERQRLILERLAQEGRVVALELAQHFRTSEDTIRRDLRELASAGFCHRVYGGALPVLPASPALTSLAQRETLIPERKKKLGEKLVDLIPEEQVVLVDAGSTNLAAMRALPPGRRLIVVTNAPSVAVEVAGHEGIQLIVVGGLVDRHTGNALGARALRDIADIHPDVYLLGACALEAMAGIGVAGFDEAEFKRALIVQSSRVIAAATSDKLGTRAPFTVGPISRIADLVVEADAPAEHLNALEREGVRIHRAAVLSESR